MSGRWTAAIILGLNAVTGSARVAAQKVPQPRIDQIAYRDQDRFTNVPGETERVMVWRSTGQSVRGKPYLLLHPGDSVSVAQLTAIRVWFRGGRVIGTPDPPEGARIRRILSGDESGLWALPVLARYTVWEDSLQLHAGSLLLDSGESSFVVRLWDWAIRFFSRGMIYVSATGDRAVVYVDSGAARLTSTERPEQVVAAGQAFVIQRGGLAIRQELRSQDLQVFQEATRPIATDLWRQSGTGFLKYLMAGGVLGTVVVVAVVLPGENDPGTRRGTVIIRIP